MKTMDCSTLEMLIENREPVDLIDIRPKSEFLAIHILGARSLPFGQLARPEGFRRFRRTTESVYVISDDRAKASLATGILRACGYMNAIVVEGGMKGWMARGLPVWRKGLSLPLPNPFSAIAVLLAIAGIAFTLAKILIVGGILISFGAMALLFKAGLSAPERRALTRVKSAAAHRLRMNGIQPAHAC
jgi:rhodanese-related sulfurtransferase